MEDCNHHRRPALRCAAHLAEAAQLEAVARWLRRLQAMETDALPGGRPAAMRGMRRRESVCEQLPIDTQAGEGAHAGGASAIGRAA